MATERHTPTPGEALRAQFDSALTDDTEWDERELVCLGLASAQADDIGRLEALLAEQGPTVQGAAGQTRLNPAFGELRQGRAVLARLLSDVRLPGTEATPNPVRQRAALARWNRRNVS